MKFKITEYKTIVFDCDGVVLNSNRVKTKAFYKATLPFGEAAANEMVRYHTVNGGVSRYRKFTYFLENIAPRHSRQNMLITHQDLLNSYADLVKDGLLTCEIAPSLEELRAQTIQARWLIVSGGDQEELRYVFRRRKISGFFDGGIFGSPDSKETILDRELRSDNITYPSLFIGDSNYDYQVANSVKLDFLFIWQWTEFNGWENWANKNRLTTFPSLHSLLNTH